MTLSICPRSSAPARKARPPSCAPLLIYRSGAHRPRSPRIVASAALTRKLAAAAGFRKLVAHAYESIDLVRVHSAATHGPADLRAFLVAIRDRFQRQASP
jgi:hypothetical protein